MFGKIKNTASKTDNYLLEMARAMLEETLGQEVLILQSKLVYEKPFDPYRDKSRWIIAAREFASEARDVRLDLLYLSSEPTGGEKSVVIEFTLTKDGAVGYSWDILRAFLHFPESPGVKRGRVGYFFDVGAGTHNVSDKIKNLSLILRGMGRFVQIK